jgi:hypothetical protein
MTTSLQCREDYEVLKNSSLCGSACENGFQVYSLDDKYCVKRLCPTYTTEDDVDNSVCVKTTPTGKIEKDDPPYECPDDYADVDGFCYKYCPITPHYFQENMFYCTKIKVQRQISSSYCPTFYYFNGTECKISNIAVVLFLAAVIAIIYLFIRKISKNDNL